MNDKNDPFGELKRLIRENRDRITILEEEIDIKLQMEYYKYTREAKRRRKLVDTDVLIERLFDQSEDADRKKETLVDLASANDVLALRALERFKNDPLPGFEKWAVLACQECKMLISSNLLNDSPVFISTGLGGKNLKLRYSLGMGAAGDDELTDFQQRIINSEMDFAFKNCDSEIEECNFNGKMAIFTVLIPLDIDVRDLLTGIIKSINQFGSFLKESFIITNMHKITVAQVEKEFAEIGQLDDENTMLNFNDDEE